MATFYLTTGAMVAVALAFVLPRLLSRRATVDGMSLEAIRAAVHRSALAEIAREHDAGRLDDAEFEAAQDDVARRLLTEAPHEIPPTVATPRTTATRATAITLALAFPALAFGLYSQVGDPKAVLQVPVVADTTDVSALEQHLAAHPRDARGYVLLGRLQMQADRFAEAAASFAQAIDRSTKVAADATVWCEYADALGMAQGGTLGGKPAELIAKALALDPDNPKALEMAGSAAFEQRQFDRALRHWRRLLAAMPADSAARNELAQAVARTERIASMSLATQ